MVADIAAVEVSGWDLTDPDAFRAFYADALPRVYGYFFVRCGAEASVAEDLTQETFLAVVAELNRGRPVAAPLPWVVGIARHKLIDHLRRQRRAGWSVIAWEEAAEEQTPLAESEEVSSARAIAALAAVPSPQREALALRHLDGLSVPEVAAALGRSVAAAESLLARGRVTFRRVYAEASDGD
ncbi:MAG TPA: RNA polymerase sigma factor [Thermomicrobiales bacterium]|jgi:RNA polymerase sigma-70 factor (ECF subfamily)|nr:RNA polymerase sigma factor [Thermomicrobiales bacterium]